MLAFLLVLFLLVLFLRLARSLQTQQLLLDALLLPWQLCAGPLVASLVASHHDAQHHIAPGLLRPASCPLPCSILSRRFIAAAYSDTPADALQMQNGILNGTINGIIDGILQRRGSMCNRIMRARVGVRLRRGMHRVHSGGGGDAVHGALAHLVRRGCTGGRGGSLRTLTFSNVSC